MSSRKKSQRIPDIVPSDFFLFDYIKRKLTEYDIPDRQSLKSVIAQFSAKSDKKPSQLSSKHGSTGSSGNRTRREILPSANKE
jgi:hypothetical protein